MHKIAYCIKDVIRNTSLSRATIYRAIGRGDLRAVKRGRRTLILADELARFIDQLPIARLGATRKKKSGGGK
jgi:excisionase family DNA binding protein